MICIDKCICLFIFYNSYCTVSWLFTEYDVARGILKIQCKTWKFRAMSYSINSKAIIIASSYFAIFIHFVKLFTLLSLTFASFWRYIFIAHLRSSLNIMKLSLVLVILLWLQEPIVTLPVTKGTLIWIRCGLVQFYIISTELWLYLRVKLLSGYSMLQTLVLVSSPEPKAHKVSL